MSSARRPAGNGAAGAIVALAAAVVVVFGVRVFVSTRDRMPSFDLTDYFLPTYLAYFGALAQGEWLRWNPYQLCGLPWLGTLQAGFFYPPHVLYLLLPTHAAFLVSTGLHLALAAVGMAVFARRLGLHWSAGAAAGLSFALHGGLWDDVVWPYQLETSAWMPLGCAAVYGLVDSPSRRSVAGLGAIAALGWLAGSPQSMVFSLYAWSTLWLALVVARRPTLARASVTGAAYAGAVALGTLAASITLLPARELASEGMRATGPLDVPSMFPLGVPRRWPLPYMIQIGGAAGFTIAGLALPFVLVGRHVAVALWCVLVGGLALVFAHGPVVGPFFDVYRALPLLSWFRAPQRIVILTSLAFAVLVALGTDAVVRLAARRIRRWPPAAPAVGVAIAAAALLRVPELSRDVPADLGMPPGYRRHGDLYASLARVQGQDRVWIGIAAAPRLATVFGVRALQDYEPLSLRRPHEYLTFLIWGPRAKAGWPVIAPWLADPAGIAARAELLHLAAVRWVVIPKVRGEPLAAALEGVGLRRSAMDFPAVFVLENPRAHPRAFVTYRTAKAPPASLLVLDAIARPTFDPLAQSLVEGDPPLPDAPGAPPGHPATIVVDEPERVEVEATLAAPGLVVLADTYTRAWQATVDGRSAPIVATNLLSRGVPVPAGTHRIRFDYASRAVPLGALASLVGWAALATLGLRPIRSRPPHAARGPAPR